MGERLQRRLRTTTTFEPGEDVMLALSVALADLAVFPGRVFRRHDLTHTQYNVLRMLRGAGEVGLAHGEITERLIMGVPDVTRLVTRLETRRLVSRERAAEDRRKVLHRITPQGANLLDEIAPDLRRFHDWLASEFAVRDREVLVGLCERLIHLADQAPALDEIPTHA